MKFRSLGWTRRAPTLTVAGALLAASLAGCGSSSGDARSTSTTVDPWAVPPTIDIAYAQRVVQWLSNTTGEVRRDVYDNHTYTEEDRAKIAATHQGLLLSSRNVDLAEEATGLHPLVRESPTVWQVRVSKVENATQDCIYARGTIDDSANRIDAGYVPTDNVWQLRYDASSKSKVNPTGWKLAEDVRSDLATGGSCLN
jgi:hypothetical protein